MCSPVDPAHQLDDGNADSPGADGRRALDDFFRADDGDCPATGPAFVPTLSPGNPRSGSTTSLSMAQAASTLAARRLRSLLSRLLWPRGHF